jgi:hypothetical protein
MFSETSAKFWLDGVVSQKMVFFRTPPEGAIGRKSSIRFYVIGRQDKMIHVEQEV